MKIRKLPADIRTQARQDRRNLQAAKRNPALASALPRMGMKTGS